ncbi:PilT/PilU family type 4a pilus ATPase [Chromobacterium piscinae]|uniref:PilT/PilU family type 4a pilus ATPase n=1 Tax=Chromobacterium piscinae TaxID=686831 RepID=UPI001C8C7914|nr:PilT/PilU family type 4a pilus ATPase [Chromobacterium piscinae]MBX9295181.1 PilT/PilU family type 4a pilus ATPase [Chromobacterium vaccinii]MBX9346487.1 PilT/PilU family type 4a pilus ATPase [Chromobacterium vaccinii]MBX9359270.1 PilT/PilU family type 4a pilus ATPase [Chromobacterium vaccinii]MCD5330325.1 PilT/PilU family type 4a pilus ATPase [Chromobacterium piscinae]
MLMLPFFKLMAEKKASDLFLTSFSPPMLKLAGELAPVNEKPLTPDMVKQLAYSLMSEEEAAVFEREREMNLGHPVPGLGSFRVNVFWQRGSVGMVVRYILPSIPTMEELELPPLLEELIQLKRGLILVVGSTGSGKSSTVAAMLQARNRSTKGHILTIEDPIEFLFRHDQSIVNQREIGFDTLSYARALKNAMREAPDVLMIGEIRDPETLGHAITYAQSGHLCISTLHGNNSYHMLNRVMNFFPPEARGALLMDLSASLRAVISQRLVSTLDGGRTPALELLINTPHISELIRGGEMDKIKEAIENSMSDGAQTFEQALFQLYQAGRISLDEALKNADSPTNLYWLVNQSKESGKGKSGPASAAGFDSIKLDL